MGRLSSASMSGLRFGATMPTSTTPSTEVGTSIARLLCGPSTSSKN
nr:MAG TPA: hypothetical protein [Caudoviricetes sp.]